MNASRGGRSVTRKAFSEEQIVYALRQAEAGTPVVEVCRKLGVTEQTFYRWRRQFAGLGIAELRRLRQLEDENKRLKQLVADLTLDKQRLQEVITKKAPCAPRAPWRRKIGARMLGPPAGLPGWSEFGARCPEKKGAWTPGSASYPVPWSTPRKLAW